MFKKIIVACATFTLLAMSIAQVFAAEGNSLFITDTKAGEVGKIYVNGPANTDMTVIFVGPSGQRMAQLVKTDTEGKVNMQYDAPQRAGEYEAYISGLKDQSYITFKIMPSRSASADESRVSATNSRAFADGEDTIEIDVLVRDEYGKVIEGLEVKMLSDDEVVITPKSQETNEYGQATFAVHSYEDGTKTLYVYDYEGESIGNVTVEFININVGNTNTVGYQNTGYPMYPMYPTYPMYPMYPTANNSQLMELQMLSRQLNDLESMLGVVNRGTLSGGDYLGASLLDVRRAYAQGSTIDAFEFDEIDEEEVEIGDPISFTIRAVDSDGEIVEDYEGTVTFESDDDDTLLPTDYTFEPADLGEHEFTLALTILNEGTQTIEVMDTEDETIEGELEITIGDIVDEDEGPVATIELDSPLSGTYSSTTQTVSGTTRGDSTVTIFDGKSVVGSVNTDDNGDFSYQVTGLSEGKHEIHILSEHIPTGETMDSEKVEVVIDISPPVLSKISIDPSEPVEEGDSFTVNVETETEAEVSVVINNLSYDLTEQTRGKYAGTLVAPQEKGEYSITVIAQDSFGNEGTYPGEATLTVKPKKKPIANVLAISEEEGIELAWDLFTNASRYKISFGQSTGNYTQQIVTIDSTPSWSIRNLEGGKDYFIQIEALDSTGQVISLPSEETSATALMKVDAAATIVTPPVAPEQPPLPDQVTQTGPEMYLVFLASIIFLDIYARIRRRLKKSVF
jgi:hypothetical protein